MGVNGRMAGRVPNRHWRVPKEKEAYVSMFAALKVGVEILPGFRFGIVVNNVPSGRFMPVVKSVAGMHRRCREYSPHDNLITLGRPAD